jgi:hypothetical protein
MATKSDLSAYQTKYGRRPYWLSLLIALDQLANALLWGYVDETLSSRAHRMASRKKRWRIAEKAINALFFWEPDHCRIAYQAELAREHFPLID